MNSNPKKFHVIESFDYQNVALRDSLWKKQRDYVIELYLSIENGDILKGTTRRAGIDTPFNGLPGWGGTLGQMIASYAKLYCVTGDFRLKAKAISLFEEWAALADEYPQLLHQGTYGYDKMIGGLLDMYEFMGYEPAKEYVSKLTDQSIIDLDRTIVRDGIQDKRMKGQIEWYTLPENVYRAYQLFGDEKYREHASVWHYDYMWNKILNHDFKIGARHAYSHVNSFSSAARAYEVTGEEKYLDVMKIAYDEMLAHHTYATGGYGPGENLFIDMDDYMSYTVRAPRSEIWGGEPLTFINFGGKPIAKSDVWGNCEISCCAWAVFKLCNYLLRQTGDAKYGVWAEQMLYNCTGGQPDIKPNGELLYYASYYADGATKATIGRRLGATGNNFQWQCCSGTFPQDVAEYANMLYYYSADGLYVSQYLPSSVCWEKDGCAVKVENLSEYPRTSKLLFRVNTEGKAKYTLNFRVPAWAKGKNVVKVNGHVLDTAMEPNTWLTIDREWSGDEVVEIDYPFSFWFRGIDEHDPDLVALNYGPIVLVSTEMTLLVGDREHPETWIKPVEGEEMTFITDAGHAGVHKFLRRTFKPYYTYPEKDYYFMYNRSYPNDEALEEDARRSFDNAD